MIAIMTWKEDLNEDLKLRLDGSRVIDSVEDLEDNIDYLDKIIISKHSEWTIDDLRELLLKLKDSGVEVIYIKDTDEPEELRLLIELDVKNILFDLISVEEIINKVENTVLFDDEDYLNGAIFIQEIEETGEKKESKEEKDIIKIENTVDVEKIVKQAVESVQPVVTVKQESTFRFLLNYIQKLLSLLVILISIIIEYFMQIAITIIVLFIVNYYISEQGINSFPALIDEIMKLLGKIKAN